MVMLSTEVHGAIGPTMGRRTTALSGEMHADGAGDEASLMAKLITAFEMAM